MVRWEMLPAAKQAEPPIKEKSAAPPKQARGHRA